MGNRNACFSSPFYILLLTVTPIPPTFPPQIMVSVMQAVSAQWPCTWSEVLSFRRDHVGTPEQAARAIVYFKSQSQYRNSNNSSSSGGGSAAAAAVVRKKKLD